MVAVAAQARRLRQRVRGDAGDGECYHGTTQAEHGRTGIAQRAAGLVDVGLVAGGRGSRLIAVALISVTFARIGRSLLQGFDCGLKVGCGGIDLALILSGERGLGSLQRGGKLGPGIGRVVGFLERFGGGDLLVELSQIDLALFNAVNRSIGWIVTKPSV